MATTLWIRPPKIAEARPISRVVRRSIVELCAEDHDDDRHQIADWLANKSPQQVARWIADRNQLWCVAGREEIQGAGAVRRDGQLLLLYVDPAARFTGISRALLDQLELDAFQAGANRITLKSTRTARRFYLEAGYVPVAAGSDELVKSMGRMTELTQKTKKPTVG
ncbi:MAG: GNAT family N-acetyltransferase [Thalassobaculaceae bacterium]|nr:GNAT family N-acetyltransferase [Thalassobaculaceae bacterium]